MNEKGYTKYRVAKALNMSATTISNYLNNKTKPDTTKLEVLSLLLGVNRNWLVAGEGEKFRGVATTDRKKSDRGCRERRWYRDSSSFSGNCRQTGFFVEAKDASDVEIACHEWNVIAKACSSAGKVDWEL